MVHQPTNGQQVAVDAVWGGLTYASGYVKNTFVHFPEQTPPPQPEELRRGRTAPPQLEAADCESDDEGGVLTSGTMPEPEVFELITDLPEPPMLSLKEVELAPPPIPGPDALCRHSTYDRFEGEGPQAGPLGPWMQAPMDVEEQMHFESYGHGMGHGVEMGFMPGAWEGQLGGQMGSEVMHPPTSGTVMLVGMHPSFCVSPDDGFGSAQPTLVPVHISPVNSMNPMNPDWQQHLQQPWGEEGQLLPPSTVPAHGFFPEAEGSADLLQQLLPLSPSPNLMDELLPYREEVAPTSSSPLSDRDHRDHFWEGLGVDLIHQPQKIGRSPTMEHVYWVVDANKLNDKAKVLVSPEFKVERPGAPPLSFKMVMYPTDRTSFRQALGQGFVQLKCETDTQHMADCSLSFRLAICNGRSGELAKREGPGKPVTWDFKKNLVCDENLACDEVKKIWNFKEVVDKESRTFAVCIEILSAN